MIAIPRILKSSSPGPGSPKWRAIFPAVYGLIIYANIRLMNDVISETKFWERRWQTNAIELLVCISVSYVFVSIVNYFLKRSVERHISTHAGMILKEFAMLAGCLQLLVMITLYPLAALTDDGIQWYDVINLSLIPLLYWLLYFAVTLGRVLMQKTYDQQLRIEQINNDKLQTELRFLRAQFHPHFLFNALNTVYFQIDEKNAQARHTIETLSELLRYQLYDQQETVSLQQELEYLRSYIGLQKQRMNEHLELEVLLPESPDGKQIYPLLLLPLVENAFKYAGGDDYRISLSVTVENDRLIFDSLNSIPSIEIKNNSGGIGLENLRRRLELLYPGGHELVTNRDAGNFKARLTLSL